MDSTNDPFAGFNPLDFAGAGETGGTPTDIPATVGPQSDGTYAYPGAAQPANQPWDVGGTASGNYSQQVLDVLKFGVGVWQQDQARQEFYDYRRFEATNGGLFMQGRQALPLTVQRGKSSQVLLWLALLGIVIIKLEH